LVSILTPSFNQGRFLGDCLRSVAAQDYARIEHVVQDGASTDGSRDVLAAARPPPSWVSEPDTGQAQAVNRALNRSCGSILGWINSDDALFSVDTITTIVRAFDRHPGIDVIFGDAAMMTADGRLLRHFRPPAINWHRLPYGWSPLSQPATFLRRSALRPGEALLNEDLHLTLDLELWLRLVSRGCRFLRVSRTLAADRNHPDRKYHTIAKRHDSEWALLAHEYDVRFDRPGVRLNLSVALGRLAGVPSVLGWRRRYRAAFAWSVDTYGRRLVRQVMLTHSAQASRALQTDERRPGSY